MCTVYLTSSTIPTFYHGCPYRTPMSSLVSQVIVHSACGVLRLLQLISNGIRSPKYGQKFQRMFSEWKYGRRDPVSSPPPEPLKAEAIQWLYETSSNTTVHSIIAQSIAGMPMSPYLPTRRKLLPSPIWHMAVLCGESLGAFRSRVNAGQADNHEPPRIERFLRGHAKHGYAFSGRSTTTN